MLRKRLKKVALTVLAGGVLLQVGGCFSIFAPVALSLGESALLTYLIGQ